MAHDVECCKSRAVADGGCGRDKLEMGYKLKGQFTIKNSEFKGCDIYAVRIAQPRRPSKKCCTKLRFFNRSWINTEWQ